MYISGIIYDSVVDGEGIRNVLFISGCKWECPGCHNPESWNFTHGEEFTKEKQIAFIEKCKENPLLDGITLSGGDPLFSQNDVYEFIKLYKENCPNHNIWLYTGFLYEDILKDNERNAILELCDVLVDGRYMQELRDTTLAVRGSSNQRIIHLKNVNR